MRPPWGERSAHSGVRHGTQQPTVHLELPAWTGMGRWCVCAPCSQQHPQIFSKSPFYEQALGPLCWALKTVFSRIASDQWTVASGFWKLLLEVSEQVPWVFSVSVLRKSSAFPTKTFKHEGREWSLWSSHSTCPLSSQHYPWNVGLRRASASSAHTSRHPQGWEEHQGCNFSAWEGEAQKAKSPNQPLADTATIPRTQSSCLCHRTSLAVCYLPPKTTKVIYWIKL